MGDIPRTIVEAAAALRANTVTSVALVEESIAHADALDPELGVYVTRFDDAARQQAAALDNELAAGGDRGQLHGIPIGIKDILAVSEGPTTAQSVLLDPVWGNGRNAIVVERLKAAGAVITGKQTAMEFASGLPDPDKPFPSPRNPWDPDRWPGGSSSGTAAGVVAGIVFAGIGTDTAGSIRIPAAYCGASGLMPTYGSVPTAGCVPLSYTLDHVGPIGRSALDCWTLLSAMTGSDPRDPTTVTVPTTSAPTLDGVLAGLTIGVEREHHFGMTDEDPALVGSFDAAVETLQSLGATLVEVSLPLHAETMAAAMVTFAAESLAYHYPDVRDRLADYASSNRTMYPLGACFSGADYVQAQRVRRAAQRHLADVFAGVDLIVMPTTSGVAPRYHQLLGGDTMEVLSGVHTMYWNAVGNPVLAVPIGFNVDGMPLSMQLAAPPFGEGVLVQAGDAYQRATDWHLRVPPLPQDLSLPT